MRIKVCMAIAIACLAAASQAAAQFCELETIRVHAEGEGVSADFSSVDASTCALGIETTVQVDGSQGLIHTERYCGSDQTLVSDVTSESNVVAVVISVYDRCLAMEVRSVTGIGEAEEFQVSQGLNAASLRAAFEGTDESDQPVSIAIDLAWNSVGGNERTSDHSNVSQRFFRLRFDSFGSIRDAVAAGSVVIDGTNETPLPSTWGTMEKDASRGFEQYR